MDIRAFSKNDVSVVADLMRRMADFHHALNSEYRTGEEYRNLEEEIEGWLSEPDILVFLAEENGKAVGYIRISVEPAPAYLDEKKIGIVDDVFILESSRRQGVAKLLYAKAEEWFFKKGVHSIELNVDCKNEKAVEFWKKHGFGERKLRMRKIL